MYRDELKKGDLRKSQGFNVRVRIIGRELQVMKREYKSRRRYVRINLEMGNECTSGVCVAQWPKILHPTRKGERDRIGCISRTTVKREWAIDVRGKGIERGV